MNQWIEEARIQAAQCWCDDDTSDIEMDARLAEAVAKRIAAWMETAAQATGNTEFYRDLLDKCAAHLGPDAYMDDEGNMLNDPVRLKIPELVAGLASRNLKE